MSFPAPLSAALARADHMDALITESDVPLISFIQGMLDFQPPWLTALYRLRFVLLCLIGHKTGVPTGKVKVNVPTQAGAKAAFFTVEDAGPAHWIAFASESHLTAHLALLQTSGTRQRYAYRVVTVVKYHNLLGRVYFAVIQPFHFLVVRAMMRHAARSQA